MLWEKLKSDRKSIPVTAAAILSALIMLVLFPLAFNDAFFDINRHKVSLVISLIPPVGLFMLFAFIFRGQFSLRLRELKPAAFQLVLLCLFVLSCIVSCWRAGFESPVLTGSEGRYCGLWFMLCSCAACFMIALGTLRGRGIVFLVCLCAAAIAALGFANAMAIDPLRFYERIRPGQQKTFMSTIGHFDFFGTYLIMCYPIAGAVCIFAERGLFRAISFFLCVCIAFGSCAARTDSAFLGLHLACFALAALSGNDWKRLSRAAFLWSVCLAALPATRYALSFSSFGIDYTGLLLMLCQKNVPHVLSAGAFAAALICRFLALKQLPAPGQKKTLRIALIAFLTAASFLAAAMVIFSTVLRDVPIGSLSSVLRFDDEWGSLRGFVYTRTLRAFEDYPLPDKLFGRGMDLTLRVLTPYFDNPAMLVGGVFNDVHSQPLQMLLTCGLFGSITFTGFYLSMLVLMLRRAGDDPVLCAIAASMCAYAVVLLLNVTQPILIGTYFPICGLGLSRLIYLSKAGREQL